MHPCHPACRPRTAHDRHADTSFCDDVSTAADRGSLAHARHSNEGGFALAAAAGLILLIVALLSAFVFVVQRDFRFKNNYAAGQRIAGMAGYAHLFSQRYFHWTLQGGDPNNAATMLGTVLFDSSNPVGALMPLPDQVNFRPIGGIRYDVIIRGWDQSPINTQGVVAADRAASAYMHVKIRAVAGHIVRPTDRTAFFSGATSRGLNRPGIVGMNIDSSDFCDGDPTVVRWGPEESACLSASQLSMLGFSDVQTGDVIIPTWEVALATASRSALFRYRQPERPELNSMTANLDMSNQEVNDIINTVTRTLTSSPSGQTLMGRMAVRQGHSTSLNQATTNSSFNVMYDNAPSPTTPAMQVNGIAQFNMTPASQVNVADTINVGDPSNPVTVDVATPVGVDTVTSMGTILDIIPHNPTDTLSLAAQQSNLPFTSLTINGDGSDLSVLGAVTAQQGTVMQALPGETMNLYTGDFNTLPNPNNPVGLNFVGGLSAGIPLRAGAVEQIGSGPNNYLQVPIVDTTECSGIGCPDYVTDNPGGGI